jgi:hypothetical protein
MQHKFFSRMLVPIEPCFHSDAVTDNANKPPKEKPIHKMMNAVGEYKT